MQHSDSDCGAGTVETNLTTAETFFVQFYSDDTGADHQWWQHHWST